MRELAFALLQKGSFLSIPCSRPIAFCLGYFLFMRRQVIFVTRNFIILLFFFGHWYAAAKMGLGMGRTAIVSVVDHGRYSDTCCCIFFFC